MRTTAFGDSALLVSCADDAKELAWRTAHGLADRLRAMSVAGVHEVVPTYDSVLVEFDCTVVSHDEVERAVASAADEPTADVAAGRLFRVPTVYGGAEGPDLADVAAHLGLTAEQVVERHTAAPLRIRCLTFPVASPLLDGADLPAEVPRRPTPRTTMPDGVVMVAGRQTALSPLGAPTGWQIIGRTPCRLVDVSAADVAPYRAGDWLHFVPADPGDWDELAGRPLELVDG